MLVREEYPPVQLKPALVGTLPAHKYPPSLPDLCSLTRGWPGCHGTPSERQTGFTQILLWFVGKQTSRPRCALDPSFCAGKSFLALELLSLRLFLAVFAMGKRKAAKRTPDQEGGKLSTTSTPITPVAIPASATPCCIHTPYIEANNQEQAGWDKAMSAVNKAIIDGKHAAAHFREGKPRVDARFWISLPL